MNIVARIVQAIDDVVDRLECYPLQPVDDYQTAPVVYRQSSILDPEQERRIDMDRLAYRQVKALEEIAKELHTLNARPAPVQPAPIIIRQAAPVAPRPVVSQPVTRTVSSDPLTVLQFTPDNFAIGYKVLRYVNNKFLSISYPATWHGNQLTANGPLPQPTDLTDYHYGIYFCKHFRDPLLSHYLRWPDSVLIQAHCWGDLAEGEDTLFRVEHARIVKVLSPIANQWVDPPGGGS